MKRLLFILAAFLVFSPFTQMAAQTPQPKPSTPNPLTLGTQEQTLPDHGYTAILWFNQGDTPHVNGTIAYHTHLSAELPGTYLYTAIDFISEDHGLVAGVPQTGLLQHIAWITDDVDLFGIVGVGMSFGPGLLPNGLLGQPHEENITAAFAGGAGVNYYFAHGWAVTPVVKVINAQGYNTLLGGIGIGWHHFPSDAEQTRRAQVKAAKTAAKAGKK